MTYQTRVGFTKVIFFIDSCDLPALIRYILKWTITEMIFTVNKQFKKLDFNQYFVFKAWKKKPQATTELEPMTGSYTGVLLSQLY